MSSRTPHPTARKRDGFAFIYPELTNCSITRPDGGCVRDDSRVVAYSSFSILSPQSGRISGGLRSPGKDGIELMEGESWGGGHWRPPTMKRKPHHRAKGKRVRTILRLPDLEHAKTAVLNSLTNFDSQRGYRHAIDEFVDWYCSEPRLAFNLTVVMRYRSYLEMRQLAPGTINLRLGAVRRLAYEAADCGLLSADLAAGIRRVKGVKKLGVRLGNWLTADQSQALWQAPDRVRIKGKRDRALLAVLLACGLRRHELAGLTVDHFQQREGHWAIIDLRGKAGHVRTIPVPNWVRDLLDDWMKAAGITSGSLFRRVSSAGKVWGEKVTEKSIWHIVKDCANKIGMPQLA